MNGARLPGVLLPLLLAALLHGGRADAAEPAGKGPPPVVLAGTISLTGKYVETGRQLERGYRIFAERANASGGILGRPVRLDIRDDRSDPARARSLYEAILRDRRGDLVLAPYSSGITLAVADLFERHRVPVVAAGASAEEIWTSAPRRYLVGLYPPSRGHMDGFLEMAATHGIRTVSILGFADTYSSSAAEGARRTAERMGMSVVHYRILPSRAEAGLKREASAMARAAPDAVVVCGYLSDATAVRLATRGAGLAPKAFAATVGPAQPGFRSLLGPLAEGVFGPSEWEPTEAAGSESKAFLDAYRKRYGEDPSYQAALGFAAGQLLKEAAEDGGSLDPERILSGLRSGGYSTIAGSFRLRPDGARTGGSGVVVQWQNHRKEIVWPVNLRTKPPRL
jgi:branched-chain amino acid transport system substrate-binding protein